MKNHINKIYNTPYQLKLPPEIEKIIEISDPVYTFCEVMENIDLRKYLAVLHGKRPASSGIQYTDGII